MKLNSLLIAFCLVFSSLSAVDWTAYATDLSNFKIITYDVQAQAAGTPINSNRCVELAITPDASKLYVINQNIPNSVSIIDALSGVTLSTITLNAGGIDQTPFGIAITPDGTTAFISSTDSFGVNNVLKFDLATNTYVAIPLIPDLQADALAITPDGSKIYFTQISTVVGMSTLTNVFDLPIPVPGRTSRIAINPNGLEAYVTDRINYRFYVIDLSLQSVSHSVQLTAFTEPNNLAVSADGLWVYLANENASFATSIDVAGGYIATDFYFALAPNYNQRGVSITPDSKTAIYSNTNMGTISAVGVGTNLPITTTPVDGFPNYLVISPDQAPTAIILSSLAPVGSPSQFISDGSSPTGTIANHAWDFGDGTTVNTANPVIQHTYLTPGNFTVTLTVTNTAGTSTTQTYTGQNVSNNGGPSATTTSQINIVAPAPTITSLNPDTAAVGSQIQIIGTNFIGPLSVNFGLVAAPDFTIVNDTLILVTVPNGVGVVNVSVVTTGGVASSPFTYLAAPSILPPTNLSGIRIIDKFLLQKDLINLINWMPPASGAMPVSYRVYGDAALTQLLKITIATEVAFHNQKKHQSKTYYVVSVGAEGQVSLPASVTVSP